MKKKIIPFAAALLPVLAEAAIMTPEDALQIFTESHSTLARKVSGSATPKFSLAARSDNDALYTYTSESGFIVLDSEEGSLIGYGFSSLDPDNIPSSMDAVLKGFAYSPLSVPVYVNAHEDIPVMLDTKWDQGNPYNLDCPDLNGERSVTGCVATAIAQVMSHPNNRMQGHGAYEYVWRSGQKLLSFDYDSNPFDYDNLVPEYGNDATDLQKRAVANLMYGIGVACSMNYHPSQSGTGDCAAGAGLIRNLGCDKSLRVENRDFYMGDEWDDMVYGQLADGHPLVYIGVSKDGGHAFVCDGYERRDDRNYYHINWGWGGMGDGYFELARLNPEYLGIGGGSSMSGFNMLQSAFFNLKPDEGTEESQIDWWQFGSLRTTAETSTRRRSVDMVFAGNSFYNGGVVISGCLDDVYTTIGFKYINTEDGSSWYEELSEEMYFTVGDGITGFEMPCQLFPEDDGTYICKLAFKHGDQWYDVREELSYLGDLTVTVSGNDLTFGFVDKGLRLQADFIGFPGEVVRGQSTRLEVRFKAAKEAVDTDVIPTIITEGGRELWRQSAKHLKLELNGTDTIIWDEAFTPATRRGTYMLTLRDNDGNDLIDPFKINVVNSTGVDEVGAEEEGAEYFTIDGLPLRGEPEPGRIVIRRAGGRTDKIVIGR